MSMLGYSFLETDDTNNLNHFENKLKKYMKKKGRSKVENTKDANRKSINKTVKNVTKKKQNVTFQEPVYESDDEYTMENNGNESIPRNEITDDYIKEISNQLSKSDESDDDEYNKSEVKKFEEYSSSQDKQLNDKQPEPMQTMKHYNSSIPRNYNTNDEILYKQNEDIAKNQRYTPTTTSGSNPQYNTSSDDLLNKLNYLIVLLEEQQEEKTNHVIEELILYCFLGVFMIYLVDSFVKVGRYTR